MRFFRKSAKKGKILKILGKNVQNLKIFWKGVASCVRLSIYGIHHWRIFRSSYKMLAWLRFEHTTTEFRLDALNDWAIRPWVQFALRAYFVQLLQFHLFVQCSHLVLVVAFVSRYICFKRNLAQVITLIAEWINTYGIHHWRSFRSSYRKLAWVGFEPATTEFRSDALTD